MGTLVGESILGLAADLVVGFLVGTADDGFALGVEVDKILVGAAVGFFDGRGEDGMIVREEDGVADSLVVGTLDA